MFKKTNKSKTPIPGSQWCFKDLELTVMKLSDFQTVVTHVSNKGKLKFKTFYLNIMSQILKAIEVKSMVSNYRMFIQSLFFFF